MRLTVFTIVNLVVIISGIALIFLKWQSIKVTISPVIS